MQFTGKPICMELSAYWSIRAILYCISANELLLLYNARCDQLNHIECHVVFRAKIFSLKNIVKFAIGFVLEHKKIFLEMIKSAPHDTTPYFSVGCWIYMFH